MFDEPPSPTYTGGSQVTEDLNPKIGLLDGMAIGIGTMIAVGILILAGVAVSNVGAVALGLILLAAIAAGQTPRTNNWLLA